MKQAIFALAVTSVAFSQESDEFDLFDDDLIEQDADRRRAQSNINVGSHNNVNTNLGAGGPQQNFNLLSHGNMNTNSALPTAGGHGSSCFGHNLCQPGLFCNGWTCVTGRRLDLSNLNLFSSGNQNTNAIAGGQPWAQQPWGVSTPVFVPARPTHVRPAVPVQPRPFVPQPQPTFPTQGLGDLSNLNAFGSNGNVNSNIVGGFGGAFPKSLSNVNIGSSGNKNTNFVGGRRLDLSNLNLFSSGNQNTNAIAGGQPWAQQPWGVPTHGGPTPGFPTPVRPTPCYPHCPVTPTWPTVSSGPAHPSFVPQQPQPTFPGLGDFTNANLFGSNGNVNTNFVSGLGGAFPKSLSNVNIGSSNNKNSNIVGGRRLVDDDELIAPTLSPTEAPVFIEA